VLLHSGLGWGLHRAGRRTERPRSRRSLQRPGRGTRRVCGRPRNRTKDDFNTRLVQVFVVQLDDLVESFRANARLGLFKGLALAFNHGTSYRPLASLVPLEALLQGNIKEERDARDLILPRQVQQVLAGLGRERGGIHYAEAIQGETLLDQEMHERKGLGLKPLIALVVAYPRTRPVRGDDLRGAEVALRECGFAARRRSAKYHDGRPDQADTLFRSFGWSRLFGIWLWGHIHS
jgi:hypothetical protein